MGGSMFIAGYSDVNIINNNTFENNSAGFLKV